MRPRTRSRTAFQAKRVRKFNLTLPLTYPLNEGFTGVKTAAFHNGTEKSKYDLQRMFADRCQHTNHEKHKFN